MQNETKERVKQVQTRMLLQVTLNNKIITKLSLFHRLHSSLCTPVVNCNTQCRNVVIITHHTARNDRCSSVV